MARKDDKPAVTISERCILCHEWFVKKHPKDTRCICERCSQRLKIIIDERFIDEDEKIAL